MSRLARRGGAALEFALVLPLLLLISLPIADYSWYFLCLQQVDLAAQSGSRAGARIPLDDDPAYVAATTAYDVLERGLGVLPGEVEVLTRVEDERMVWIEVRVPYKPITHFIEMPAQLRGRSRMLLENP